MTTFHDLVVVIFFLPADIYLWLGEGRDKFGGPGFAAIIGYDRISVLILGCLCPSDSFIVGNTLSASRVCSWSYTDRAHLSVVMTALASHWRMEEITVCGFILYGHLIVVGVVPQGITELAEPHIRDPNKYD